MDFIADNGKLTCGKPGQEIENFIVDRIHSYIDHQDEVIFTMDLHYENDQYHPETQLFLLIIFTVRKVVIYMEK